MLYDYIDKKTHNEIETTLDNGTDIITHKLPSPPSDECHSPYGTWHKIQQCRLSHLHNKYCNESHAESNSIRYAHGSEISLTANTLGTTSR